MNKKKIAFICVHNSCRSQIAEALGKHFAGEKFDFYSAGTETKPQINQDAVRLMMGCEVGCPYIGRAFDDNWGLPDPTGESDTMFETVIKEIEKRISELSDTL